MIVRLIVCFVSGVGLVGEEKVSGSITIPEVAHDTEEDEYVVSISLVVCLR